MRAMSGEIEIGRSKHARQAYSFDDIAVVGDPEYVQSNFVRGISKMMVRLTPKSGT